MVQPCHEALHGPTIVAPIAWGLTFRAVLNASSMQGPRMVRDVFRLAKENAPAIIFIDEVDAIATARFDAQTGADRSALPSCCLRM